MNMISRITLYYLLLQVFAFCQQITSDREVDVRWVSQSGRIGEDSSVHSLASDRLGTPLLNGTIVSISRNSLGRNNREYIKRQYSDGIAKPARSPHLEFSQHSVITPMVLTPRSKRSLDHTRDTELSGNLHHSVLSITLPIDGVERVLDLHLNKHLIPGGFFERRYGRRGQRPTVSRPNKEEVNLCHYQGKVRGVPSSWAAVSTCDGVSGIIYDGEDTHYIEKVPPSSGESGNVLSAPHYLLNHRHLLEKNLTCGYKGKHHPALELFKDETFTSNMRFKRNTDTNTLDAEEGKIRGPYNSNALSRYVELVLVADHLEYQNQGQSLDNIHKRFKDIANIANALYQPLNIFIALVGVEVWEEEDQVEISPDGDQTLTNFLNYRKVRLIPNHPNDNAQLLTGQVFDSGVVGKALKGPICTYQYSGGVNMDHSSSVGLVATTVAHEMGHNFGMEHDTEEECKCPDSRCIMAPSSGSRSPSHWSSCSHEYLALSFERSMDYCLRNKPESLFESPICGNSFVEEGEQCDCGLVEHCDNPCCDPHTCMLYNNATCATGHCCDLTMCQPKAAGTVCREALRECDLPEYCQGDSEYCPSDYFKEDGHECHQGRAYCHDGMCRTHEQQCKLLWGPTGQNSHDACYSLNTEGDGNGNCGYNWANDTYYKCRRVDRKCGMMHCKHFNERLEFGMESVSKVSHKFIVPDEDRGIVPCRVAQVDLGLDMVDPGLAPDGSKCGYEKMCVNQVCMAVASLRKDWCHCNGNGACNNLGHCHCAMGFAPPDCLYPGMGGSIDSGPAANPNATNKFVVGLLVFFLGIVPIAVIVLCIFYQVTGHLGVLGIWLTKKGLPGTTRLSQPDGSQRGFGGGRPSLVGLTGAEAGNGSTKLPLGTDSKSSSPLLNGGLANGAPAFNELIGKHDGFTMIPINGEQSQPEVAFSPMRKAPCAPNVKKPKISGPSFRGSTNKSVWPPVATGEDLPPSYSSVVNSTYSKRPLSVPEESCVAGYVIPQSASDFTPSAPSLPKPSPVPRFGSFLSKKDHPPVPVDPLSDDNSSLNSSHLDSSRSSTLPRKASKINREALMQMEISSPVEMQTTSHLPENLVPVRLAPVPPSQPNVKPSDVKTSQSFDRNSQKPNEIADKSKGTAKVRWAESVQENDAISEQLQRNGSMREQPVTMRPSVKKFGSMRTSRPKSLPPTRPTDPPPRPPLPEIPSSSSSENYYDACADDPIERQTTIPSPSDSLYATIEDKDHASNLPIDEPYYENNATLKKHSVDEGKPPTSKKPSVFSFLYTKVKRKKKNEEDVKAIEEPLYCNIEEEERVSPEREVVVRMGPSNATPKREIMADRRTSSGSSEGGLLSEIVSELVTREPEFTDALSKSRKKEERQRPTKLPPSVPPPSISSTSSPAKSQKPSVSESPSKPKGVLSYLKRNLSEDKPDVHKTLVSKNAVTPDIKNPFSAVSNTTITTQIELPNSKPDAETKAPHTVPSKSLESSLASVRAANSKLTASKASTPYTNVPPPKPPTLAKKKIEEAKPPQKVGSSKDSTLVNVNKASGKANAPGSKIVFPPDKVVYPSDKIIPKKEASSKPNLANNMKNSKAPAGTKPLSIAKPSESSTKPTNTTKLNGTKSQTPKPSDSKLTTSKSANLNTTDNKPNVNASSSVDSKLNSVKPNGTTKTPSSKPTSGTKLPSNKAPRVLSPTRKTSVDKSAPVSGRTSKTPPVSRESSSGDLKRGDAGKRTSGKPGTRKNSGPPASRGQTAFGGKVLGSSNVASLQQKFEGSDTSELKKKNNVAPKRKTSDSAKVK